MQSAKNLHVYAFAMELAKLVYRATANFPNDERYGLTAQMRRAAVSIGSNIAEGCGRRGDKELAAYLYIALGSASELEFQCELAAELEYAEPPQLEALKQQVISTKRMRARLILAISEKKPRPGASTVRGPSDRR